jgi:hypothetical protein
MSTWVNGRHFMDCGCPLIGAHSWDSHSIVSIDFVQLMHRLMCHRAPLRFHGNLTTTTMADASVYLSDFSDGVDYDDDGSF